MDTLSIRDLPPRLHLKHGAFYYVVNHQWTSFGTDREQAISRAEQLNALKAVERLRIVGRTRSVHGTLKEKIFARDDYKCVYCGATSDLVIDHVIPFVHGGSTDPRNVVTACAACNFAKRDRDPMEFLCAMKDLAGRLVDAELLKISQ